MVAVDCLRLRLEILGNMGSRAVSMALRVDVVSCSMALMWRLRIADLPDLVVAHQLNKTSYPDAGSTGEEQRPAGSLSNEASQARPVHAGRVLMQGRD